MAAIPKEEYPNILRMIDEEGMKPSQVAKVYGVVPRTIYIRLARMREEGLPPVEAPVPADTPLGMHEAVRSPASAAVADNEAPAPTGGVFIEAASIETSGVEGVEAPSSTMESAQGVFVHESETFDAAPAPVMASNVLSVPVVSPGAHPARARAESAPAPSHDATALSVPKGGSRGAQGNGKSLARQWYGIVMRPEDGEEQMLSFRSLDDLLSGFRPILRSMATGTSEDVWFKLVPIQAAEAQVAEAD